jgi:hypothetical protein
MKEIKLHLDYFLTWKRQLHENFPGWKEDTLTRILNGDGGTSVPTQAACRSIYCMIVRYAELLSAALLASQGNSSGKFLRAC